MTSLHELFDASAQRFSARAALRCRERTLTYEQLQERSVRLAGALEACGARRGDRVVVHLQNRPETVEVALACSRIGAIFVPTNPMLKARQLEHILRDSGARMLFASSLTVLQIASLGEATPHLHTMVLCDTPQSPSPAGNIAQRAYESLFESVPGGRSHLIPDGDPAALLYTSGSTGRPKGVVVSHRNLVVGARIVANYLHNEPEDRILAALPLSFDYGLSQVTTAFSVGACAVLTNFALPAALMQELAAERITGLAGVPTMWAHLSALEWPAAVTASLRYITNSGGALTRATLQRLQAQLPSTEIFSMYGLTEAFRSTYLDPAHLQRNPGSIGRPLADQEVFVVRADGSRCDPGEVGEIVHRGSLVTLGYWNNPQATRERFRALRSEANGVAREEVAVFSGDLGRADEEGFLYFVARNDQLLKSSGYRISPTELEEVVSEVPPVLECAALGLPDETLGQRIVMAVVFREGQALAGAEAVRQHCRMHLPPYMVPSEVVPCEQLPRSANGKVDRAALLAELLTDRTEPGLGAAG